MKGGDGLAKSLHGNSIPPEDFQRAYNFLLGHSLPKAERDKALLFLITPRPRTSPNPMQIEVGGPNDQAKALKVIESRTGYSMRHIKRVLGISK